MTAYTPAEWALKEARRAYEKGPEPSRQWTAANPPNDLEETPPSVYRLRCKAGDILEDSWVVNIQKKNGDEFAILFLASYLHGQEPAEDM